MTTPMPIDQLRAEVEKAVAMLRVEQMAVADALRRLARAAEGEANAVETIPPEAMTWSYLGHVNSVRQARVRLDNARADLTAWGTELNRREGLVP